LSLRPEISGFSLTALRRLAGSRDSGLVRRLTSRLDELIETDDPDFKQHVGKIVEQAVMKGIPFPGLDVEEDPHVMAVQLLALEGQEHLPTGSNIWKHGIFDELLDGTEEQFGPETTRLLRYFIEGRPLLGKQIASSWSHYAWLETREVKALHGGLANFLEDNSDPTGEGFLEEFQSWLASIHEAGRDLWLFTQ